MIQYDKHELWLQRFKLNVVIQNWSNLMGLHGSLYVTHHVNSSEYPSKM
jgi:hypothetical protein